MFRRTALLFVLAAVALWSVPGLAAEKDKKAKTAGGKVKSIDAGAHKLVLEGKKTKDGKDVAEKEYKIAGNCKVTIDDEAKALSDVAAGKYVQLTLAENGEVCAIAMKTHKKKEAK